MQASAKGERRSDFDWPWRYSETILIWTKKGLKEPKPKTCFVLTQDSPNRRLISTHFIIHSHNSSPSCFFFPLGGILHGIALR